MPYDISKLRMNLKDFLTEINYNNKNNDYYLSSLFLFGSRLSDALDKYYNLNNDGAMQMLSAEDLADLISKYRSIRGEIAEFIRDRRDTKYAAIRLLAGHLLPFLEHDISILENADLSVPKSIDRIMAEGMAKVLEVPEDSKVTENCPILVQSDENEMQIGHFKSKNFKKELLFYKSAELLGLKNYVQEIRPVIMLQGEKLHKGIFIRDTYGLKIGDTDPQEPGLNYDLKNFENPRIFKNIADAQALDFILGVNGRQNSIRLRFAPEPSSLLCGITLENDVSLFSENLDLHLSDIGVISQSIYDYISNLDENEFKSNLKNAGATSEAAYYVWKRLTALKNKADADMEFFNDKAPGYTSQGHIRVVKDEEWALHTAANLSEIHKNSYFNTFSSIPRTARLHLQENGKAKKSKPANTHPVRAKRPDMGIVENDPDEVKLVIPPLKSILSFGANNNTRYAISYNDKRGFFTPAHTYSSFLAFNSIFDKYIRLNPRYADFLIDMKHYYRANPQSLDAIIDMSNDNALPFPYSEMGYTPEEALEFMNDPIFKAILKQLNEEIGEAINRLSDAINRGYGQNQRADMKNVLMSEIGDSLGTPDLLARSRLMEVEFGGKLTKGVFTEYADGIDLYHIPDNHPLLKMNPDNIDKCFNNPNALKSIADLQILDFICLNSDRHNKNMIYKFEGIGTDSPTFTGVIGIDNDTAFGTKIVQPDNEIDYLTALNNISVISEEMYLKLQEPETLDDLESKMRNRGLSDTEVSNALDRVRNILSAVDMEKIRVVEKNDWGKGENTLTNLVEEKENASTYFYYIKEGLYDKVNSMTKAYKAAAESGKPMPPYNAKQNAINFAKCRQVDGFGKNLENESELRELETQAVEELLSDAESDVKDLRAGKVKFVSDGDAIHNILRAAAVMESSLNRADPLLQWSSSEYRAMKRANKALKEFATQLEQRKTAWEQAQNQRNIGRRMGHLLDNSLASFNSEVSSSENDDSENVQQEDNQDNQYLMPENDRAKMESLLNALSDAAIIYKNKKRRQFIEEDRTAKDIERLRLNANQCVTDIAFSAQNILKESRLRNPMEWLYHKMNLAQAKLGKVFIGTDNSASIYDQPGIRVNDYFKNANTYTSVGPRDVANPKVRVKVVNYAPSKTDINNFRNGIAEILYYRLLTETGVATKKDKKFLNALTLDNVKAGKEKIMNSKAFDNLMKKPAMELLTYAVERKPKNLMALYKKELAKEKQQEIQEAKKEAEPNNSAPMSTL